MAASARQLPNLDEWADDFDAFLARFGDLFARSEPRERAARYVRALLGGVERRNGWQLAEAMGEARPRGTQRLLTHADWSAAAARDRLLDFAIERFGDADGVAVFDETGFIKKGTHSVGVARQYTGTAGKIENAQVGVFLGYASRHGHALLDRGLYLPRAWTEDPDRCAAAGVPATVRFRTKPVLARRLLTHAVRRGLPVRWVTGDEVYGDDPKLRAWLATQPYHFVLAVARATPVWGTPPRVVVPTAARRAGRPDPAPTRPRVTPRAVRVEALAATWPATAWTRLAAYQGEKGPITYDWAARRVVEKQGRLPGGERWLLVRRSVTDPTEHAYYLSDAPADTPLATLARVAATRFTIEQCFLEAKDDVGMDQYEVRSWDGWYRYITLCLMAVAWVASVRRQLAERAAPSPPSAPRRTAKKGGPASARRGPSRRSAASS